MNILILNQQNCELNNKIINLILFLIFITTFPFFCHLSGHSCCRCQPCCCHSSCSQRLGFLLALVSVPHPYHIFKLKRNFNNSLTKYILLQTFFIFNSLFLLIIWALILQLPYVDSDLILISDILIDRNLLFDNL